MVPAPSAEKTVSAPSSALLRASERGRRPLRGSRPGALQFCGRVSLSPEPHCAGSAVSWTSWREGGSPPLPLLLPPPPPPASLPPSLPPSPLSSPLPSPPRQAQAPPTHARAAAFPLNGLSFLSLAQEMPSSDTCKMPPTKGVARVAREGERETGRKEERDAGGGGS